MMENLERAIVMMEAAGDAIRGNNRETALAYLEDASDCVKDELFRFGDREEERAKCNLLTI